MGIDDILKDVDKVLLWANDVDPLLLRQMYTWIEKILSLTLGILIVMICLGIPLITALDIAYMSLPIFRNKFTNLNLKQSGKIRFISNDAIQSLEESFMREDGNALSIYLRKRLGTYIIVAIVLTVVLAGGWDLVLVWVRYFAIVIAQIIVSLKTAIVP